MQSTIQVVRQTRRSQRRKGVSRGRSFFGIGRAAGGSILSKVEGALGKGLLYGGVASKFVPSLAPIAQLYGEYKGGGIEGLALNEILVNPFLGYPSALGNVLGPGGLLGNLLGGLGGSSGGLGGSGQVNTGMMAAV